MVKHMLDGGTGKRMVVQKQLFQWRYIKWCSIYPSEVQANTKAGFSIVLYTGTGASSGTMDMD